MPKRKNILNSEFSDQLQSEFCPNSLALIGVSGGRDSMALLHLLNEAGFENLIVCHLNHDLRGDESQADADFVRGRAKDLGLIYEIEKADVKKLAEDNKWSVELAARNARHEFFSRMVVKHDCEGVFLAHHADDQVETVLMNFFRGSGMSGLCGMHARSEHQVNGQNLTFYRPLLDTSRDEIDVFCHKNGIPFREDTSNADPKFALRNRLRHQLIPNLGEVFGRDVRGAVLRMAQVAQMEEDVRSSQVDALFPKIVDPAGQLDSKRLEKLKAGDQFRIVVRWLGENEVPDCGFAEIERVLDLLSDSGDPAKINLPGDIHARRKAGRIFLEKPKS